MNAISKKQIRERHEALLGQLQSLAPSIAITQERSVDRNFRWDGDGPDPRGQGFWPYDVTVKASVILKGQIITRESTLGGSYDKPGNFCPDVHGYFVQMAEEATEALSDIARLTLGDSDLLVLQFQAALKTLRDASRERYAAQIKSLGKLP